VPFAAPGQADAPYRGGSSRWDGPGHAMALAAAVLYSANCGNYPSGDLRIIVITVLVFLRMGRVQRAP
jgi:hypothetical protein